MAIVKNDPFPGTDYSRYQEWEKVVMPNGETYYVVPGHPAYVLDKTASNATGRTVFRNNPKPAIDEAEDKKRQQDELINQEKFNRSPTGQLLPIVGTTGGLIAASHFAPASALDTALAAKVTAEGGTGALLGTGSVAATPTAVTGIGPIASGTGYATSLAAPAAAETAPAVASTGVLGTGLGVLPLAAIAAGTYLGGKSAYNMLRGKNDKSIPGLIGRGTLGIATGGLSEIARPFLMHESTRDVAKKHTSDLLGIGKDDSNYQQYVTGMREQYKSAPPDPSKPFAGKYETWEDYQKGGLEANDLTGVYGNIKTYGPAWANLTQDQRVAVTDANIKSGIYTSNKGEVEITDEAKAKENFDNVMKGFNAGVKATTQGEAAAQGSTQTNKPLITPIRSTTRSPGIGMDGNPIFVSR